jgi:LysM repeat protein
VGKGRPVEKRIILIVLVFMLVACNSSNDEETSTPNPLNIVELTEEVSPTAATQATPTAANAVAATSSPQAATTQNATRAGCTVRTDWVNYTVQANDNLSSIASRAGTTVNELVTANCLTDANTIRQGQTLVVPRTPATFTPGPSATPSITNTPQNTPTASATPAPVQLLAFSANVTSANAGDTVTLSWEVTGAKNVRLQLRVEPSGETRSWADQPLKGSIQYTFPAAADSLYRFYLAVIGNDGQEISPMRAVAQEISIPVSGVSATDEVN